MTAGRDEGQSSVELALVLPLLVVLLLAVVQVALVARDEVLVVHAARAGARAAAADDSPAAAGHAARSAAALDSGRLSTRTSYQGGRSGTVTVVVRYRAPTDVPVVGRLLPDVNLEANAAMRVESPSPAGRDG